MFVLYNLLLKVFAHVVTKHRDMSQQHVAAKKNHVLFTLRGNNNNKKVLIAHVAGTCSGDMWEQQIPRGWSQ